MSFFSDVTWPTTAERYFQIGAKQNKYFGRHNGAYSWLLHYCFNAGADPPIFTVVPTPHPDLDFVLWLIVTVDDGGAVFVVEVKDKDLAGTDVPGPETYKKFKDMRDYCPLPRLWFMRCVGPSVCFHADGITTEDPSLDILSPEGFRKMKEMVEEIVHGVEAMGKARATDVENITHDMK